MEVPIFKRIASSNERAVARRHQRRYPPISFDVSTDYKIYVRGFYLYLDKKLPLAKQPTKKISEKDANALYRLETYFNNWQGLHETIDEISIQHRNNLKDYFKYEESLLSHIVSHTTRAAALGCISAIYLGTTFNALRKKVHYGKLHNHLTLKYGSILEKTIHHAFNMKMSDLFLIYGSTMSLLTLSFLYDSWSINHRYYQQNHNQNKPQIVFNFQELLRDLSLKPNQ